MSATAKPGLAGGLFSGSVLEVLSKGLLSDPHLHPRTRIRHYVWERLIDSGVANNKIYHGRVENLQAHQTENLPAIGIYTREEPAEIWNAAPRQLERVLDLHVQIVAAGESAEDTVDEIAFVIERLLGADRGAGAGKTLGGHAVDIVLAGSSADENIEGAAKLAGLDLTFSVTYREEVATLVGDDFLGLGVDWDTAAADKQLEAEDDLDLSQEQ